MGLRLRSASVFWGLALGVACGGRAQEAAPLPPVDTAAGAGSGAAASFGGGSEASGGASTQAGTAAQSAAGMQSVAGAPSAGAPNLVALGCPDPTGSVAACPAVAANLDFGSTSGNSSSWVEPLQIPQFGTRPAGYYPADPNVDPALWDRAALPAGACVFRLHGVPGSCLRPGRIDEGSCLLDGVPPVSPGDFYENNLCGQGVAPGCPTSDPWAPEGYWWYMVPRGVDTDVVICAPECAQQLQLSGECCLIL
jgi:hypothetical protein